MERQQIRKKKEEYPQPISAAGGVDQTSRKPPPRIQFFHQFDRNGDGVIDKAEMKEMFRQKLGKDLSDQETDRVFSILDKDGDGTVRC